MAVNELKGLINQGHFVEPETCVWTRASIVDDGKLSYPMFIMRDGNSAVIGGNPPCPMLVFIGTTQEDHYGLKSLSS